MSKFQKKCILYVCGNCVPKKGVSQNVYLKTSFVWKKSTQKNEAKMQQKMKTDLPKLATEFNLGFHVGEKL